MSDYKGTCFCGAVEVTATGKPKQKDVPAELGGSGVLLAE